MCSVPGAPIVIPARSTTRVVGWSAASRLAASSRAGSPDHARPSRCGRAAWKHSCVSPRRPCILDLGGTDLNWRLVDQAARVLLLNTKRRRGHRPRYGRPCGRARRAGRFASCAASAWRPGRSSRAPSPPPAFQGRGRELDGDTAARQPEPVSQPLVDHLFPSLGGRLPSGGSGISDRRARWRFRR